MFDNLRDDASASFYDEPDTEPPSEEEQPAAAAPKPRFIASKGSMFLGMTPVQRFIIAFLLMIAVCALGTMSLLITGKIGF